MIPSVSPVVLLLSLASASPSAAEPAAAAVAAGLPANVQANSGPTSRSGRVDVRLFDLAAVRRLFHTLARRGDAMSEGERAAALADFSVMTDAVVGGSPGRPFTFDELTRAAASGDGPRVSATTGVARRDEAAYQLLGLGYSARETADVVSGRISQQALDTAQRPIAIGSGRAAAADHLDSQYRLVIAAQRAQRSPRQNPGPGRPVRRDARIRQARAGEGERRALRFLCHVD